MDPGLCRQTSEVERTWALQIHGLVFGPLTHLKEKCFCQKGKRKKSFHWKNHFNSSGSMGWELQSFDAKSGLSATLSAAMPSRVTYLSIGRITIQKNRK